MKRQTYTPWD